MPLKGVEGVKLWLHVFLMSALDRAEGLNSDGFTFWKEQHRPSNSRLCGPQNRFGHFREKTGILVSRKENCSCEKSSFPIAIETWCSSVPTAQLSWLIEILYLSDPILARLYSSVTSSLYAASYSARSDAAIGQVFDALITAPALCLMCVLTPQLSG
jgi:hypothetical protein